MAKKKEKPSIEIIEMQNRREFIKGAAAVAAGLSLPLLNSCSSSEEDEEKEKEDSTNDKDNLSTDTSNNNDDDDNEDTNERTSDEHETETSQTGDKDTDIEQIDTQEPDSDSNDIEDADPEPADTEENDSDSSDIDTAVNDGKTIVGMVRDGDITKMVRDAIELAGGLDSVKGGDKVVIKPNITGYTEGYHICTSSEVLRAVIQAISVHTDKANITVAECTAFGRNTRQQAKDAGILSVCEEEGINFLAFESQPYAEFSSPKWKHLKDKKRVPKSLSPMSFDHFINVPILKNHEMPASNQEYTCCMKNFVGLLPFSGTGSRMSQSIHSADLGEKAAELGLIVPEITMNVVDATTIMLTNGPAGGTGSKTAKANLVLASTDRVACDSVAVAILKHYAANANVSKPYVKKSVWKQAQIMRARELGLGAEDPALIEIVEQGVDNFEKIKSAWV